jgi:hypothetical protein
MATHVIAVTDVYTVLAERLTHEEQREFARQLADLVRERLRAQGIHNVSVREAWGGRVPVLQARTSPCPTTRCRAVSARRGPRSTPSGASSAIEPSVVLAHV